jgi:cation diffusion facilitator family transporter
MKNLQAIRRVLYITMALNLVAMAAKLVVGYWTGALSLVADGYDSLFDAAGNVIGLVGIYIASRPADREHPYGHRKFETFAAIVISLLLFVTTWELVESALERLRDPASIDLTVNAWSFGSLVVSIAVHVFVVTYELRAGRRLKSDVLVADALHTRADIYISLSVVGGLVAVRLGYPVVDPLLALVIAVLILKIGIDIIRESSKVLLDGAVVPISEIERIVLGVRDVRACHDIRSRGHEDAVYVDLHVKVAPEMSTARSHAIAHDVQHRLRAEIPAIQDVVVHVEPENAMEERAASVIPALRALAKELDIQIHDIAARWVNGASHVEAHVTMAGDLSLAEAHARVSQLERESRARIAQLADIVTHIEPVETDRAPSLDGAPTARISAGDVEQAIRDALDGLSECGPYHDVRVHPEGDGWATSLHCLVDGRIPLQQAHSLGSRIEEHLLNTVPRLNQVVVHTDPLA